VVRDLRHKSAPPLFRYGIALALPAFALLLLAQLQISTFSLSAIAVLISAWYGGLWPGLVSSVLSVLGMAYILPPHDSFGVEAFEDVLRLGFFALLSILISSIIEARYKAEDALRENQRLLTCLLDYAPMPIAVSAPSGQFTVVNRAWEQADMRAGHATILRLKNEAWTFETAKRKGPLGNTIVPLASPVVTQEVIGTPHGQRYFQTYKFPVHDNSGNVEAIGAISLDITEIRKADQALREQHKPQ